MQSPNSGLLICSSPVIYNPAPVRKGDPSFPRLPGNSHLLHRGVVLHRLHGGDSHLVPDEEHDQKLGLQQPAAVHKLTRRIPLWRQATESR